MGNWVLYISITTFSSSTWMELCLLSRAKEVTGQTYSLLLRLGQLWASIEVRRSDPWRTWEDLPELDALGVRRPLNRIFCYFDFSVSSLFQFFGYGPDVSIVPHSLFESLWVNPRLNEIKRSLSRKAAHQDLSINFQYKLSG